MSGMLAAFAGLAAGFIHVLSGPDHLAAVAPLAADGGRTHWRAGFQWGLGHTAGVLAIGVLLIAFRELVPIEAVSSVSERVVGAALIAVGAWGLVRARRLRAGGPDALVAHVHARASFLMGVAHGLAGSSHLFGVLPALALPTFLAAAAYLGGFGAGAVAAMTAFAAGIGVVAGRARRRGIDAQHHLLIACSCAACVVGAVWIVR